MTGMNKITTAAFGLLFLTADAFYPLATPSNSKIQLNALFFNDQPENVLTKSDLPGNLNFDPLHLAETQEQLVTFRKAEIKHARLAILVVMGILWSDLHVVDNLGATSFFEGRAFPEFLGACVGLPVSLELYAERVEEEHVDDKNYFPGQLDLDPFHLYPACTSGQRRMQFTEIMVGRVCMVGAAERLIQNLLAGMGVMNKEDSLLSLLAPAQSAVESMEEVVL